MLGLTLALLGSRVAAGTVFLDVVGASESEQPLAVMAGVNTELKLTLIAPEVIAPQLTADLYLIGGPLVAPLSKGVNLETKRMGAASTGVQRFKFNLEIPVLERRSQLLLRLHMQTSVGQTSMQLPAVTLEVLPSTWKHSLQAFTKQISCGRLESGERLARLFEAAGLDIPQTPPDGTIDGDTVQVCFGEFGVESPPLAGTQVPSLWIIFKKDVRDGIELGRARHQGPLVMYVDETALKVTGDSAAAQALLERVLAMARTLTVRDSTLLSP